MSKLVLVLMLMAVLLGTGCATKHSGSVQFIPGTGWVPTD
jgi:hypothetical protein